MDRRSPIDDADPGRLYDSVRVRLSALLCDLGDDGWDAAVPACPGWRVRDVLAHLVGVIEDAAAGRIDGPPSPEVTADEVARHAGDSPEALLAAWDLLGPEFSERVGRGRIWPAAIDVISHEHDIRAALGRPGARDHPDVGAAAAALVVGARFDPRLEVVTADGALMSSGTGPAGITLTTSAFEVLRLRMGRRSRAQAASLDWSADPGGLLEQVFVFGPAAEDIHE